MLLLLHHRLNIGDKDHDYEEHSMVRLVEVFAIDTLNDDSNITVALELCMAERLFTQEVEMGNVKTHSNIK